MIGAATFSERFGYMDAGCDHDKSIEVADKALDYFAAVGQMPFLDFLMDKNPVVRIGPPNLGNVTRIAGMLTPPILRRKHVEEGKVFLTFLYYSGTSHYSVIRKGPQFQPRSPRLSRALPKRQEDPPGSRRRWDHHGISAGESSRWSRHNSHHYSRNILLYPAPPRGVQEVGIRDTRC